MTQDDRSELGRTSDYLLRHNNNPLGYAYQTILPTATVAASLINPVIALRTAIPGIAVGTTASGASNAISKLLLIKL